MSRRWSSFVFVDNYLPVGSKSGRASHEDVPEILHLLDGRFVSLHELQDREESDDDIDAVPTVRRQFAEGHFWPVAEDRKNCRDRVGDAYSDRCDVRKVE